MAKVKVYSRLEQAIEFRFGGYTKGSKKGGVEAISVGDDDKIVINGINEVYNHGRVIMPYAATVFSDDIAERSLEKRQYPLSDLERLKKHAMFKKYLKNGAMSIDTTDDISKDITGGGKVTDKELAERLEKEQKKLSQVGVPTFTLTRS